MPNFHTILKGTFVGSLGLMLGGLIALTFYKNHPSAQAQVIDAPKQEIGCSETARVISGSFSTATETSASCKPRMFIENVELENGNILILCRCTDPLACVQDNVQFNQQPLLKDNEKSSP